MTDYFAYRDRLADVAAEDIRFLLEKDKQYGGSWKRSGGRSAWYMLVRKIDRLKELMKAPEPPPGWPNSVKVDAATVDRLNAMTVSDDVFAQIQRRPGGEDGSCLAEVRDLRRYLMLVEAEMVAQGVVTCPPAEHIKFEPKTEAEWQLLYSALGPEIVKAIQGGLIDGWGRPETRAQWQLLLSAISDESIKILRDVVLGDLVKLAKTEQRPGTPEDGGHHEGKIWNVSGGSQTTSDVTLRVNDGPVQRVRSRFEESPEMYEGLGALALTERLEDGLTDMPPWQAIVIPAPTGGCYYNVDRAHYSDGAIEHLPELATALNHHEWSSLRACYRGMYKPGPRGMELGQEYIEHWTRK